MNKKLVLITQDYLLSYMRKEFHFEHLREPAKTGDSMHFHSYRADERGDCALQLFLDSRLSTDADGVSLCLGLQAEARIEMAYIIRALEQKVSQETLFQPV